MMEISDDEAKSTRWHKLLIWRAPRNIFVFENF